jgi:GPH family glycoside/pentoside/hexuronide:cation symporter
MICNAVGSLLFLTVTPASSIWMYGLMAFSGFSAIGIWVTQISASADVIEWDEERTGQRQEGAYGGLTSMAIKTSIAVSMLMVGPLMSWLGYRPGARELPAAAIKNLRMLFAIAPAVIYFASAAVFSKYPITREAHRAMRERLAARNADKPAAAG